jgi:hypothetical protein
MDIRGFDLLMINYLIENWRCIAQKEMGDKNGSKKD